ncbi:MAG: hypothetical protein K0Q59_3108 [Paenibacillus sp.]|jgi:UPF0716 protein FxsA|nr:hypothetical protein [Paenibacillus sp.]
MMRGHVLLALFIVVPALEIWTIVEVGQRIGGWQTFVLIVLSGFVGATLSKREAAKAWASAQHRLSMGQMPTLPVLDGICVFVGGLFLLSPGFLTDLVGLLLVLPFTRPPFRRLLHRWIQKKLAEGGSLPFFRNR